MSFKFPLGVKARDVVTEFEGTITARTEYQNGCRRYIIVGTYAQGDGKDIPEFWSDEQQIELLVPVSAVTPTQVAAEVGGPRDRKVTRR